ncbi:MAG TPA: cyanophycinase, partial [Burkholderiaceae bacterium]|nr:cyanophycinase [Burkholderiaceae bacterium]
MPKRPLLVLLAPPLLLAQQLAQQVAQQPAAIDPDGVPGARIIAGGGTLPAAVHARFVELAGGEHAHIVLMPGASATADDADARSKSLADWQREFPQARFAVLHTRDRATADSDAFAEPLRTASGVWFGGGDQQRLADAYLGTGVERELQALLARGGVVGGTSAGAAIQSRTMIADGNPVPVMSQGFDFVPHGIVDQHFVKRNRLPRLLAALHDHPGHFGLGVDEGTAIEVRGRELRVFGDSKALLVLAAGAGRPQRVLELVAGDHADLVSWQRAARDRAGSPWPPVPMAAPVVPHGTLVIIGGGALPDAAVDRFVAAAGGKDAKVVIVPTALGEPLRGEDPFAAVLRRKGVTDIRVVDCPRPGAVTDAALKPLADATAIWFGGGRQWHLCDAYEGTKALAAFAGVLARGGVIGGSSAGATIQGEFLVRGNPLGNL